MKLHPIGRDGTRIPGVDQDETLMRWVQMMRSSYSDSGYEWPWIGYVAEREDVPLGICGFKSAPANDRVEIAYATLPHHEGKGVATGMAARLVEIAFRDDPTLTVVAQTLPERNASSRILAKLGFVKTRETQHPEDGTVWEWEKTSSAMVQKT